MSKTITNQQLAAEVTRLAIAMVDRYGERTNELSMAVRMDNIRIYTRGGRWVTDHYKGENLPLEINVYHVVPTRGALEAVKHYDAHSVMVDRRRAGLLHRQFLKLLPLEALASL